ncbi:hypothetical protein I2494_04880 [Budviciaceae bacterium BWR-B9]|uniref:Uncharacterized protein n=1 Tax=Limnobaculum allomyrinae TaxID=2791986 RepID=A0ABS1INE5_9GAMM|nr:MULTISPECIES: hypothetical protein [Limnobaculum]MBK5143056.1 hypothetical protein [Limnobaculum allomyrinae]MBV7693386.1 hypothetical protein [Limnobaculum sp. M2-1]
MRRAKGRWGERPSALPAPAQPTVDRRVAAATSANKKADAGAVWFGVSFAASVAERDSAVVPASSKGALGRTPLCTPRACAADC